MNSKRLLTENKIRATTNRIAVLKALRNSKEPLSVSELINHLRKRSFSVDKATVFRIINLFTEKNIVLRLNFGEGRFRYELALLPHHHHIVCKNCGTIREITRCINMETLAKETTRKFSFLIQNHRLDFFGICAKCQ